jgi:hypothetical protein
VSATHLKRACVAVTVLNLIAFGSECEMFCRNHGKWVLIGVRCETLSASLQVALSFQATRANGTFWTPCLIAAHDRLQACLICLYDLLLIYFRQKKERPNHLFFSICMSDFFSSGNKKKIILSIHLLGTSGDEASAWRQYLSAYIHLVVARRIPHRAATPLGTGGTTGQSAFGRPTHDRSLSYHCRKAHTKWMCVAAMLAIAIAGCRNCEKKNREEHFALFRDMDGAFCIPPWIRRPCVVVVVRRPRWHVGSRFLAE